MLDGSVREVALDVDGDKRAGDTTFLVMRMREGMKRNHTIIVWEKRCNRQAVLWW